MRALLCSAALLVLVVNLLAALSTSVSRPHSTVRKPESSLSLRLILSATAIHSSLLPRPHSSLPPRPIPVFHSSVPLRTHSSPLLRTAATNRCYEPVLVCCSVPTLVCCCKPIPVRCYQPIPSAAATHSKSSTAATHFSLLLRNHSSLPPTHFSPFFSSVLSDIADVQIRIIISPGNWQDKRDSFPLSPDFSKQRRSGLTNHIQTEGERILESNI